MFKTMSCKKESLHERPFFTYLKSIFLWNSVFCLFVCLFKALHWCRATVELNFSVQILGRKNTNPCLFIVLRFHLNLNNSIPFKRERSHRDKPGEIKIIFDKPKQPYVLSHSLGHVCFILLRMVEYTGRSTVPKLGWIRTKLPPLSLRCYQ